MGVKKKIFFWVKLLAILTGVLGVLIIVAWLMLPGYLKDYIETHDKEWIDRDITLEKIKVNVFKFSLDAFEVEVTEPNSKKVFVSSEKVHLNMELFPLFNSNINFEQIAIDKLKGNIIQNGSVFNFSDLFESDPADTSNESSKFSLDFKNVDIRNSTIHYFDKKLGSAVVLDSIFISDKSFTSSDKVFDADVSFHQPNGGTLTGDVSYGLESFNYTINTKVNNWQLITYEDYLKTAIRFSEFGGTVNADLKIEGNTKSDFIACAGYLDLLDLKLVDPESKPLVSVGKFHVGVNEINTKSNIYDFKDIVIDSSFVTYEYLTNSDNFSKIIVSNGEGDSLSQHSSKYYVSPFEMLSVYIYDMTKEYIFKSYSAEKVLVSNLNLKFYDYTLEDPFHMDLANVQILSEDIKPTNEFADFVIAGVVNNTGKLDGSIAVSRQGIENMKIDTKVENLVLNSFSPYGRYYTAHRFQEGVLTFKNSSVIKNSYLTSVNHFHVDQIKVSKKDKTSSGYSLPLRLAVAIVRDVDGNVDLEIPVEGPINDPEYKFGKVIWSVVKNLFTKMVKSPAKALSNLVKVDENDLKSIYFDNGQKMLGPGQKKSLDKIALVLKKKEEFNIVLSHLYNKEYEIDIIALKLAKVAYLKQSGLPLLEDVPLGKQAFDLSSSDPDFLIYLKAKTPNYDETFSTPENARRFLGQDVVTRKEEEIALKQKELVKNYLTQEKGIGVNRFEIKDLSATKLGLNQSRPKFEVTFAVE